VAVQAMLDVLERCFATQLKSADWQTKMKAIVPSYGQSLIEDADLLKNVRDYNLKTLNLV
jgi:malate dehydrogenase (quinone)